MSHGQPDFGMYTLAKTIYRLSDMGELAARLGSIVTFDRRGDVVWLDSFEDGLGAWNFTPGRPGALYATDNDVANRKGFSLKLTTDNVINTGILAASYRAVPVIGCLGFEVSFTGPFTDEWWEFYLDYYDGAHVHRAIVRLVGGSTIVTIWVTAPGIHTFNLAYQLHSLTRGFHTLKLVADFGNDIWKRVIIDNQSWSLTDYGLLVQGDISFPRLYVAANLTTRVNAVKERHIDDVILTQNEP